MIVYLALSSLYLIPKIEAATYENPGSFNYFGNDIAYLATPFSNCAAACDDTYNCVGYLLHVDKGSGCWLKSGLGNRVFTPNRLAYVKSGTLVSSLVLGRNYSSVVNYDFSGNDISYLNLPFESCATACCNSFGCVGYVLHKDKGTGCWLKRNLGNRIYNTNRETFIMDGYSIAPAGPSRNYTEENVDYPGDDIIYSNIPFIECPVACDTTYGCVGYVLHEDKGAGCWLKKNLGNRRAHTDRKTFIASGYSVKAPSAPRTYSNESFDFPGGDIIHLSAMPFTDCAAACDKTDLCVGYTLHKDKGAGCSLKSSFGHRRASTVREAHIVTGYTVSAINSSKTYHQGIPFEFRGEDIATVNIPFAECKAACDATYGCVAYVLLKDRGIGCQLKKGLVSRVFSTTRETHALTGQVVAPSGPARVYSKALQFDFPGGVITTVNIPFDECKTACDSTIGCVGYTLLKDRGIGCQLKNSFGNKVASTTRETFVLNELILSE